MDCRPTPHIFVLFTIVVASIVLRVIYLLPVISLPLLTSTTVKVLPVEHRVKIRDISMIREIENMAAIRSLQSISQRQINKHNNGEILPNSSWMRVPRKSLKQKESSKHVGDDMLNMLNASLTAPNKRRFMLNFIGKRKETLPDVRSESLKQRQINKHDNGNASLRVQRRSLKHKQLKKRGRDYMMNAPVILPNKRRFMLNYIWKHKGKLPDLRSESKKQQQVNTLDNREVLPKVSLTVSRKRCQPKTQVVLVKTHKTASSTMASILQRYGMRRNFTFATPMKGTNFPASKFKASYVFGYDQVKKHFGGFNMLVCHARYNRTEMDRVVPNATYITLLRNPVDRFISSFIYYNYSKQTNISSYDSLTQFLINIEKLPKFKYGSHQISNGMAQDLGFTSRGITNKKQLAKLGKEFDLVLISDYFDESLLLLKKQLCLKMDDLLYLPFRKHFDRYNHFYEINDDIRARIIELNKVDAQLFQHFNRTFWEKVKQYGPTFNKDLNNLRTRLKMLYGECAVDRHKSTDLQGRYINYKTKVTDSEKCRKLFIIDDNNSIKSRHLLQSQLEALKNRANQSEPREQSTDRKRHDVVVRRLSDSKKVLVNTSMIFPLRRVIRKKHEVR